MNSLNRTELSLKTKDLDLGKKDNQQSFLRVSASPGAQNRTVHPYGVRWGQKEPANLRPSDTMLGLVPSSSDTTIDKVYKNNQQ